MDEKRLEEIWRGIKNIPVLRFLKDPVNYASELYVRYPDGGEYGWFAFVISEHLFYAWNIQKKEWSPVGNGNGAGVQEKFTANLTVRLKPGKSFGKYVNGDIIPAIGKTAREVIIDACTDTTGRCILSNLKLRNLQDNADINTLQQGTYIYSPYKFTLSSTDNQHAVGGTLKFTNVTTGEIIASGLSVSGINPIEVTSATCPKIGSANVGTITIKAEVQNTDGSTSSTTLNISVVQRTTGYVIWGYNANPTISKISDISVLMPAVERSSYLGSYPFLDIGASSYRYFAIDKIFGKPTQSQFVDNSNGSTWAVVEQASIVEPNTGREYYIFRSQNTIKDAQTVDIVTQPSTTFKVYWGNSVVSNLTNINALSNRQERTTSSYVGDYTYNGIDNEYWYIYIDTALGVPSENQMFDASTGFGWPIQQPNSGTTTYNGRTYTIYRSSYQLMNSATLKITN